MRKNLFLLNLPSGDHYILFVYECRIQEDFSFMPHLLSEMGRVFYWLVLEVLQNPLYVVASLVPGVP